MSMICDAWLWQVVGAKVRWQPRSFERRYDDGRTESSGVEPAAPLIRGSPAVELGAPGPGVDPVAPIDVGPIGLLEPDGLVPSDEVP